ncbi:AzlD domain-containing protein [Desulfovibrio ferrophilus]|uniref:Branched-chain amino acid transport n=1 Tax=Desulfovibrio ferrophilus TaxID=241368 RepID=A0A2Z6B309_9BACT|nr:AzlD domain-containing protein [Desulfovibrio ferrophilus]BBD09899.1 branched-chain amino acid transport [Desulfovibrio ferrophilus]
MDQTLIFATIVGMALVTYIPRAVPLLALASRNLPPVVVRWLGYVPTAVLSAMLAPCLLLEDGAVNLGVDNLFLLAAIPTFLTAIFTRSFFGSVAMGMGLVALGRYLPIM